MEEAQRTIARPVSADGVGLHTGRDVRATLRPAPAGAGITFRREDVEGARCLAADVREVTRAEWEVVLGSGDEAVRTVEHLLAAVAATRIDNLEVRLDGPEPPALDGSARPWCDLLGEAGVTEQEAEAAILAPEQPLRCEEGRSRYAVLPYPRLRITAEIDFEHPSIGRQFASVEVETDGFCREVAAARTFGLEEWGDELRSRGLALGASDENTVILRSGAPPEGELRYVDEFVRHKVIDLVGDLALVGARLRAHVVAERPGHRGNVELARRLRALRDRPRGGPALGIEEILEYIPHRYPFLLVDRILEFEAGRRIVGLKNVTINEPFFTGHFPGHPIMPGVLIVEAMAQVGGLLLMNEFEDPAGKVVYFVSMDDVKFRKPVVPGDQLLFELELAQLRGRTCRMRGVGRVDGKTVAEATMTARVMDR